MYSPSYKRYVILTLLVVYTCNFMDRQILALLMEPIKQDLQLTDTQLGFLSGIAFALFYCTLGIPIARWADRGNRVTIISLAVAIWSAMTALSGMATTFLSLLLARIGVGVGEAGCTPPAHSLIADYFPRAERPRALATYMMGTSLGILFGYSIAGWINELYGWRAAFLMLGLPGLLLAVIVKLTIKEPRVQQQSAQAIDIIPLKAVLPLMWRRPALRHLVIALSLINFLAFGIGQWFPAFFIRTHGMGTGELGTWLALVGGISGVIGTWLGGYAAVRFAANQERLQMRALAIIQLLIMGVAAVIILSPLPYFALVLMGVNGILGGLAYGPAYALVQGLVEERLRAMVVAILFFVANLVGMGLGPQAIGLLSDGLRPLLNDASLRWAMLASLPVFVWAAVHYWLAGRTAEADLDAVEAASATDNQGNSQQEKAALC